MVFSLLEIVFYINLSYAFESRSPLSLSGEMALLFSAHSPRTYFWSCCHRLSQPIYFAHAKTFVAAGLCWLLPKQSKNSTIESIGMTNHKIEIDQAKKNVHIMSTIAFPISFGMFLRLNNKKMYASSGWIFYCLIVVTFSACCLPNIDDSFILPCQFRLILFIC